MKAIPTKYGGTQFRSRLEARWAAFFDAVEWRWEYEPVDLDGYIPDFIVWQPWNRESVLVEVKPIVEWPCSVAGCPCGSGDESERVMLDEAIGKIQQSGWKKHAIVVGAALKKPGRLKVPEVGCPVAVGEVHWTEIGTVLVKCRRCPRHFLAPDIGKDDGGGWEHFNSQQWCQCCDSDKAVGWEVDPTQLWREAGNRVQWRAS